MNRAHIYKRGGERMKLLNIFTLIITTMGFISWLVFNFYPIDILRILIGVGFGWCYGTLKVKVIEELKSY